MGRFKLAVCLAVPCSLFFATRVFSAARGSSGADVCPEPNNDLSTACFLDAGGVAPGYLDSPGDVDGYRVVLPADSMIVATLSSLPGDYGVRIHLPDGTVKAQAMEPGRRDKVVRADGLEPGEYFLSVVSRAGDSNPDEPYMVSVRYPESILLRDPTALPGADPQGAYGYVPAPAKTYGLDPSDVGLAFREVGRQEPDHGRLFRNRIVGPDATQYPTMWVGRSGIWMVDTSVYIEPYGSNEDLEGPFETLLEQLRSRYGANVQKAHGWGSEKVYSYAWPEESREAAVTAMHRGIALKHRNAVVLIDIVGLEQDATWDAVSRLMRLAESRVHAAAE